MGETPATGSGRLDLGRPRRLGELLACTFALQRTWFAVFFSVTALVNVPFVIGVDGLWNRQFDTGAGADGPAAAQVVGTLLSMIVLPALVTALHVRIVQRLGEGEKPTIASAFRLVLSALGPALVASLLYAIGLIIGLVCLVIPGVVVLVSWYFAPQAAIVDGTRGPRSLARSSELVRGHWWAVAGRLLAVGVIGYVIVVVPARIADAVTDTGLAYVTIQATLGTVALSISALFGTLLFFSLRAESAPTFPRRDAPDRPSA